MTAGSHFDWRGAARRGLLALEPGLALVLSALLVHGLPLRWTIRRFGGLAAPAGDPGGIVVADVAEARRMTRRLRRVADRLPWRSTCLVRALAGAMLLRRRGITGATIRLGVRKTADKLEAHAWLLFGPEALLGGEEAVGFTPLADLGG